MASMVASAKAEEPVAPERRREPDQRVFLRDVSWQDFEALLRIRGDRGGVRMAYLEGEVELMSPSIWHEGLKKTIARLVEAYADELQLDLFGYGSWTVKNPFQRRGLEPDECYILGAAQRERPDLAIEVIWTHGGLSKLDIYQGLGVPEVWIWRDGRIQVHLLGPEGDWRLSEASLLLPDLDLRALERFSTDEHQPRAVRSWRAWLREDRGRA